MNPATIDLMNHIMGEDKLEFSLKHTAKALLSVSLVAAVPIGAMGLLDAHQRDQMETLSASLDTVAQARAMTQAAHASGIASGLTIGGIHVPADLVDRIASIVEAEMISGTLVLSEARMTGLEAALSGNWTTERLEEYVSLIETVDPDLGRIIAEETDRLSRFGVREEHARTLMRAMVVRIMSGEPLEGTGPSGRVLTGSDAERAGMLDRTQTRIWSRLEETNRVGGLDATLTRGMAIAIVGRMLEQGSTHEAPTP